MLAPNQSTRQKTNIPPKIACLFIPPLLADPFAVSLKRNLSLIVEMPSPPTQPVTILPSFLARSIWLNVKRKAAPKLAKYEPGSTVKGTPPSVIKRPRPAPRTKAPSPKRASAFPPRTPYTRRHQYPSGSCGNIDSYYSFFGFLLEVSMRLIRLQRITLRLAERCAACYTRVTSTYQGIS